MSKILVIDHSADLLDLFRLLFTQEGFEVRTADSPHAALPQLPVYMPDLVLLDIVPQNTGWHQLCQAISEKDIPVILLSTNHSLMEHFGECRTVDTIDKPFDIEELLQKVKAQLVKV